MSLKIKSYLLSALSIVMIGVPAILPIMAPAMVSAECSDIAKQVANGADQAANGGQGEIDCESSDGVSDDSIAKLANGIVNVFSVVVGAVAVLMIIYGGFRYITSGGDSNGVGAAKNTLVYAIVGLIIVALAQLIVHFVLNKTGTLSDGS